MSLRRTSTLLVLALAASLVAGCGGGGEETTEAAPAATEPSAPTREELIERGDAICAEVNAAVGTVTANSEGSAAGQVAGLYSSMVASLNNLGTPLEADGYAEFSAAAESLAKAEDEVELAAERGDAAALETAESNASSALAEFRAAAEEYGFEECGEGPSTPSAAATREGGGAESPQAPEAVAPEAAPEAQPEAEAAPEAAPETGGAGGAAEGGAGGGTGGGETGSAGGGGSGGIGPG